MKERVSNVCKALGVSMRQFGIVIGRSGGWVNSLSTLKTPAVSSEDISRILDAYPAVNKDYILSGIGDPLRDDADTLSEFPESFEPRPDDYRELCMAYRQDLAEMREETRRLREAYLLLLENNNKLMENYSILQAACLKTGINPNLPLIDRA